MMNKIEYKAPEITVITFQMQDIITTSDGRGGVDLPLDPAGDDSGRSLIKNIY